MVLAPFLSHFLLDRLFLVPPPQVAAKTRERELCKPPEASGPLQEKEARNTLI